MFQSVKRCWGPFLGWLEGSAGRSIFASEDTLVAVSACFQPSGLGARTRIFGLSGRLRCVLVPPSLRFARWILGRRRGRGRLRSAREQNRHSAGCRVANTVIPARRETPEAGRIVKGTRAQRTLQASGMGSLDVDHDAKKSTSERRTRNADLHQRPGRSMQGLHAYLHAVSRGTIHHRVAVAACSCSY